MLICLVLFIVCYGSGVVSFFVCVFGLCRCLFAVAVSAVCCCCIRLCVCVVSSRVLFFFCLLCVLMCLLVCYGFVVSLLLCVCL